MADRPGPRPRPGAESGRGESGAASLLVVAMASVLLFLTLGLAWAGAVVVAHRQTQTGADLAALAGAVALVEGGDACGAAAEAADRNGVRLAGCSVEATSIVVVVTRRGPGLDGLTPVLGARARAGFHAPASPAAPAPAP